jgi:hypothetical protein
MSEKPTLSVPELQRILVAAAQNLPATEDVVDVRIAPRGEGEVRDWTVAHWHSTGTHAAAGELRAVADRLRQVFAVTV